MIPYYIQKHAEADHTTSNRKVGICPICGREELISKDSSLVKCSICCQMQRDDKPAVKGEKIKNLREKIGISLKSLADDLKIDSGLLSKIENNKRPVNSILSDWYQTHSTRTDADAQIPLFEG